MRKISVTRDEVVQAAMRADSHMTLITANRIYQQMEHDAGGREHAKWCAGPDMHIQTSTSTEAKR